MNDTRQKSELHYWHVQNIIEFWHRINLCPIRDGFMDFGEDHYNHPHITDEHGDFLRKHFPFGIGIQFGGRLNEDTEIQFFNYAENNPHMWDKFREYVQILSASQICLDGFILTFLSTDLGNAKYDTH